MDWHQQIVQELIDLPLSDSRSGKVHVKIGHHLIFDLGKSFPATTAKKLKIDLVAKELQCFLSCQMSKDAFHALDLHIWDKDMEAARMDDLGKTYGRNWRHWGNGNKDQLRGAIDALMIEPYSRRALVTAWNPDYLKPPFCALPPCPVMFQFNILHEKLYTSVYQRSADLFLGLPFDIAQYAIISRLVANELGIQEANLDYHISNLHLYQAHERAANIEIHLVDHPYPTLSLSKEINIDNFHWSYPQLLNYQYTAELKTKLT